MATFNQANATRKTTARKSLPAWESFSGSDVLEEKHCHSDSADISKTDVGSLVREIETDRLGSGKENGPVLDTAREAFDKSSLVMQRSKEFNLNRSLNSFNLSELFPATTVDEVGNKNIAKRAAKIKDVTIKPLSHIFDYKMKPSSGTGIHFKVGNILREHELTN